MRYLLLFLVACSTSQATTPARNLVCERLKLVDEKAECAPELTDVGELHTHRARIKQGTNVVACTLTDRMVSMACDSLVPVPKDAAKQP